MKKKRSYAVIGLGRFGMPLARKLAEAKEEVIAVDCNEERVREMREYTDYAFVAKSLNKEVLMDIGIQNCDVVIICIGDKIETSILVTLNVINLKVPKVISKATSAEQGEVLEKLGAEVVYPERDMALRVAKKLLRNNLKDFISIGKDIEVIEISATQQMAGKSILDMDVRKKYSLNIIALQKDGNIETEVDPKTILNAYDSFIVIGNEENVARFVDDYS